MIKAAIVGATGYTGAELVRFLSRHPDVQVSVLTSQSYEGRRFTEIYPNLRGYTDLSCIEQDIIEVAREADVVFTALPHGVSMGVVSEIVRHGKKVIDLGADYRFDDHSIYQDWYKVEHTTPDLLKESVYGLPEINRDKIKDARIIGNPGCYPTSIILALAPLLKNKIINTDTIIVDSKSGVSGAGRGLNLAVHYAECNENIKAYNIGVHRHTPEIEQELSKIAGEKLTISFTPHLTPMTRGILSTIYATLAKDLDTDEVLALYNEYYEGEKFVRVQPKGVLPQTKWVFGSNYCDIGLTVDPRVNRVIICSAIDNLVKGASGQAIQNMNIMFGLPEESGLNYPGIYP